MTYRDTSGAGANRELTALLGEKCVSMDVNSHETRWIICVTPVSVIREAEELAAEAFGAPPMLF